MGYHTQYKLYGEIPRGIVAINTWQREGQVAGLDVFQQFIKALPVDLEGIGTDACGIAKYYILVYLSNSQRDASMVYLCNRSSVAAVSCRPLQDES